MAPIPAGRYEITFVSQLPPDTYLASVSYGNQNALRDGVEVTADEATLELLIRSGAAVLNGKVVGKQGPEKGFVILVPDSSIPGSTFLSSPPTATDQNGEFQIRNLTPGSYTIYTLSARPADDFRGSEFLKKFEGQGRVVTLNRNDTVTLELNVIDEPARSR
jgi:hypothetical protein